MQLTAGTCYDVGMYISGDQLLPGMLFHRHLASIAGCGSYLCLVLDDAMGPVKLNSDHKRCMIVVLDGMEWWIQARGRVSVLDGMFRFARDELVCAA